MKKKFSLVVIFFIVGIAFAAAISTSAFQEAYRSRKIEKEVADLKLDAQRVQSENDALAAKIAYLQTPEFQEKVAKEKLNLQKPDENVVVVKQGIGKQVQDSAVTNNLAQEDQDVSNYRKWWNFFFKY